MLSYRHGFHAGNHADVLKHIVLTLILNYLKQKNKPYWFIDTHAGAGKYSLESEFSNKTSEYLDGISKIFHDEKKPLALEKYIEIIQNLNGGNQLKQYPGSPWIASQILSHEDKIRLFELHPTDLSSLLHTFSKKQNTKIYGENGFQGLKALIPPPSKRAIVLVDPSYEIKNDYHRVVESVKDSLKRFETGIYMYWCPLIGRNEPLIMLKQLQKLKIKKWLYSSLSIAKPSDDIGLFGSYLFIINPPYRLKTQLEEIMPYLSKQLGLNGHGSYEIDAKTS
jgi:23S rRNA (adenine2030-N6)-methyltransferase